MRSASGPARKMASVALSVCEDTVQPSCRSVRPNVCFTNTTAPVNSEPSKPRRKPLSAMISIVPIAPSGFANGIALHQLGLEHLLHVLRLIVDVLEHPARRHGGH